MKFRRVGKHIKRDSKFREYTDLSLAPVQEVERAEFDLGQAGDDAEIEVARPRGAARAEGIMRSTLSGSWLN